MIASLPPLGFTKRDIERMTILRRLVAAKRAVEAGFYSDDVYDALECGHFGYGICTICNRVPLELKNAAKVNGVEWVG